MRKYLCVLLAFIIFMPLYAEDSNTETASDEPVPYSEEEFPQWSRDLRRTEIITLGSLPFVTLSVGTAYSSYLYFSGGRNTFPNPFNQDDGYSKREIFTIVGVSAGISAAVGLTDFVISYIKRKQEEQEKLLQRKQDEEKVRPITPEEAGELLRKSQQKHEKTKEKAKQ